MKTPAIAPEEWDFRPLKSKDLELCLLWEYSRQSEKIRSAVSGWFGSKVEVWGEQMTVLAALEKYQIFNTNAYGPETRKVWGAALGKMPPPFLAIPALPRMLAYALDFNVPFLRLKLPQKLQEEWASEADLMSWLGPVMPIRPMEALPNIPPFYSFHIDFAAFSPAEIKEALTKWVDTTAKELDVFKEGKAASRPFERLKWLSTLRLSSVFTYQDAQDHIENHTRKAVKAGCPEVNDTLPRFTTPAAWSRAKARAEDTIAHLEAIAGFSLNPTEVKANAV